MTQHKLPFAEDVNYWQTGKSSPDTFIQYAINQIADAGGKLQINAFGLDSAGNSAYMLQFELGGDTYKVVWPVLPIKHERSKAQMAKKETAAKRQAATLMFHDIKAKCMTAKVLGARPAFFQYLMLPDGRTTTEATGQELAAGLPDLFNPQRRLSTGVVEGEYE
jgi:hypothetical protein